MRKEILIYSLLVIISGLLILSPFLNVDLISQGDHGRDFYCARAVLRGDLPYRDFWWVYGPLMPYYYAVFYKLFGVQITSVLAGELFIELLCGLFIFLILVNHAPPLLAYVASLWYWAYRPDFFFTYNHPGGILCLIIMTYALLRYIHVTSIKYLWAGLAAIFTLCLIKINFGLFALVIFLSAVFIFDRLINVASDKAPKHFYILGGLIIPPTLFMIYYLLLRELPMYAIRQCLPYLRADHPHNAPLFHSLLVWWQAIAMNINAAWGNRFFALLIISLGAMTIHSLLQNHQDKNMRKKYLFAMGVVAVMYILHLHEYLVSNVLYRTEWGKPFSILLIFLIFGYAFRKLSRTVGILIIVTLFFAIAVKYKDDIKIARSHKIPLAYLNLKHARVFCVNSPRWNKTVTETTNFLNQTLQPDETFFALPYDPLYYFLTDRPSPTRQLIFFDHINIPEAQERKIIADLEKHQVNYILISNRSISFEPGMGTFGETYCPLLGQYIAKHFHETARFGEWQRPAGWAWNHGTKILKRE